MEMIRIDNLNIRRNITGDGIPVVVLHGWGGRIESMGTIAERLAMRGFQVHVLDLPGFGSSELPPQAWGVGRYAQFVNTYLDVAQIEKARLIGHSFGGRISIYMGAEYPAKIEQIVLVDSAGVRPEPSAKVKFYLRMRDLLFMVLSLPLLNLLKPAVKKWLRQRFGSEDFLNAGALEETFKLVINEDLVPFARRVQAPTLLIWGDQDQDTPLSHAKILEEVIPNAGLVVFNGAGHYSYLDRPVEFVNIVTNFFRNV